MKLYIKHKKDFVPVEDYGNVRIGAIIKVYSDKTDTFINKVPYFVSGISDNDITLDTGVKKLNFNIRSEALSLK